MQINKDLIIEDSNVSLKEIPVMKNNLDKINSRKCIWAGTAISNENITINTTWENLGRFKNLVVITLYTPTNVTSSAIFSFEQMVQDDAKHLNEKKRVTNAQSVYSVDGAKVIQFIPSQAIGSNTIKFWMSNENNYYIKALYIDY